MTNYIRHRVQRYELELNRRNSELQAQLAVRRGWHEIKSHRCFNSFRDDGKEDWDERNEEMRWRLEDGKRHYNSRSNTVHVRRRRYNCNLLLLDGLQLELEDYLVDNGELLILIRSPKTWDIDTTLTYKMVFSDGHEDNAAPLLSTVVRTVSIHRHWTSLYFPVDRLYTQSQLVLWRIRDFDSTTTTNISSFVRDDWSRSSYNKSRWLDSHEHWTRLWPTINSSATY